MRKIVAIFVLFIFAAAHGVTVDPSLLASIHVNESQITGTASKSDMDKNEAALHDIRLDTLAVTPDRNYLASAPQECCDTAVSDKSAATHCTVDCMVALASHGPDFQESSHSTSSGRDTLDTALLPVTLLRPPIS